MERIIQPSTTNERGDDVHPAFGVIGAYRGSSHLGQVLFDSDIKHTNTVRIRIKSAVRSRELNHDWIHSGREYIEVELSEAQWASFVSSMNNGDGVPCTVRYINGEYIPEMEFAPRLAQTMAETHEAAHRAYDAIKKAFNAVEDLDPKTPIKERREAMATLRAAINNAVPNVDFAGKQLIEQTEDVVTKARADIEAYVVNKAVQLGLEPGNLGVDIFSLGSGDDDGV